ncbi:arylsulfatase regulator [Pelotomaculum thermopropionicum SI]|uniref:Arylsulfatase regulator n=1 Tax=Pelotomaculum thermopropionicum (strain DSM 13744 / JCM 10971 / SI) TaxID=370438 RepID=A5D3V5_PELTS|nr:arylsulfatase regulator [Pelotomaculum thermopropionicum SI]
MRGQRNVKTPSIRNTWLNSVTAFIGEYTGTNPGYSPRALAAALAENFLIRPEDAEKLASFIKPGPEPVWPGLAGIELNLTFNCNLACEYCFIHDKSPAGRMTFATAKNAVDLLVERAAYPAVNITLIGGEPLLEFELIKKIVPYALEAAGKRNLGVTWSVTTNGTLINEDILKFFASHKIGMLLSIDGGPATHDRYRRTKSGEGTWHKIAGLIPLIKKYQPWLGARMTVSTEAVDTMWEDYSVLVGMGINQFIIAPAQGARRWTREQVERYGLGLVKILLDYHRLRRRGIPLFIEEFEKDESEYGFWGCRAGSTSLAVAPNGDVSPCSKMLGLTEEAGKYIIGNVNSGIDVKLLEPFRHPAVHQPRHCKRCSRKCTGGCYAVNFEQTGSHFTASEENCLFWAVCQETRRLSRMIGTGRIQ